MNDPKRLLESGTEIERTLLSYGTTERPAASARHAVLAALGAPTMTASTAPASSATLSVGHASASAKGLVVLAKWGGATVLAGALAVGAAAVRWSGDANPPAVTAEDPHRAIMAGPDATPGAAMADVAAETVPVAPSNSGAGPASPFRATSVYATGSSAGNSILEPHSETRGSGQVPTTRVVNEGEMPRSVPAPQGAPCPPAAGIAAATEASELSAEVDLLEQARTALASGNPDQALYALDLRSTRITRPVLEQEAQVLRVESLMKAGRAREAVDLALSLRAAHPRTPYAKRIEAVLRTQSDAPNP
jgi:hypothetical protein